MTILLFVVGLCFGVIAHEAGHALAARILGFPIRQVSIGTGPRIAHFRAGKIRFILHLFPIIGDVLVVDSASPRRIARALLAFAGPGANAAILGALGIVDVWHLLPPSQIAPVAFAQFFGLFMLIPFRAVRSGKVVEESDGLGILKALILPHDSGKMHWYSSIVAEVPPLSWEIPLPTSFLEEICYDTYCVLNSDDSLKRCDCAAAIRMNLDSGVPNAVERAYAIVVLIHRQAWFADIDISLDRLDIWSLEALALSNSPIVHLARGQVLTRLGRRDEARAILLSTLPRLSSPHRNYCCAFLHEIAQATGDSANSQYWFKEAERQRGS